MFHRHLLYVIFYLNWYINRFICLILTFFLIIWENIRFSETILFYNFIDFSPLSCIYFVSPFKCVNIFNINVDCFLIWFFLRTFEDQFPSCCKTWILKWWLHQHLPLQLSPKWQFWIYLWCFGQFSFHILNHMFSFKEVNGI